MRIRVLRSGGAPIIEVRDDQTANTILCSHVVFSMEKGEDGVVIDISIGPGIDLT